MLKDCSIELQELGCEVMTQALYTVCSCVQGTVGKVERAWQHLTRGTSPHRLRRGGGLIPGLEIRHSGDSGWWCVTGAEHSMTMYNSCALLCVCARHRNQSLHEVGLLAWHYRQRPAVCAEHVSWHLTYHYCKAAWLQRGNALVETDTWMWYVRGRAHFALN